jgi:hypothetical protein
MREIVSLRREQVPPARVPHRDEATVTDDGRHMCGDGLSGDKGPTSEQGSTGEQGLPGERGEQGLTGLTGEQCLTGLR